MKKKILVAVLIIASAGAVITYNEVIRKPFPFLATEYITDADLWNAAPNQSPIDTELSIGDTKVPQDILAQAKAIQDASLDDKILWATTLTRQLQLKNKGGTIRTEDNIFADDPKFLALCSETSKIFSSAMHLTGTPSRIIWMDGHTVNEVYDGENWVMVDAYGNVRAYTQNGNPAGILHTLTDFKNTQFRRIIEQPDGMTDYLNGEYLNKDDNVYADQDLLVVISNNDVFDFHTRTRDLKAILNSTTTLNPYAVGHAMQFVLPNSRRVGNYGIGLYRRLESNHQEKTP